MDEVNRLAYRVLEAFESIPELRLEWLILPDEPGHSSEFEMEVAASETFFGNRVSAEVRVPVRDLRDLSTEQLRRFFARELVERGGYGRAVAEARVIGEAATRGVPAPGEAQKN
ncbi:MAG: hypothetical protein M3R38_26125 [Actinomycetota bacterium]|nr:hypothetical protein [Actinomycetota bacterium]MDP9484826.1 hypothetical protein [Actinomycetota bacterium]